MLHFGEEQELCPSHQLYLAGCNLNCVFCTVAEWNDDPHVAEELDIGKLKEIIARRKNQGARTLNLLGGEPTVNLHGIIELLAHLDSTTTVVLNSNMYYDRRAGDLMSGLIDIYLADLKCANASCAKSLLGAADYAEVAKENILRADTQGELIVRHLLMPGHRECCLEPVLRWLREELPKAKVSLRFDYVPPVLVASAPTGYLKETDMQQALDLAREMGLNLVR
jgi:putative pyruvate formate lyase activating enzyme